VHTKQDIPQAKALDAAFIIGTFQLRPFPSILHACVANERLTANVFDCHRSSTPIHSSFLYIFVAWALGNGCYGHANNKYFAPRQRHNWRFERTDCPRSSTNSPERCALDSPSDTRGPLISSCRDIYGRRLDSKRRARASATCSCRASGQKEGESDRIEKQAKTETNAQNEQKAGENFP